MIIKREDELQKIRKAGEVLAQVRSKLHDSIEVGKTTLKEIDDLADKLIADAGCTPSFKNYFTADNRERYKYATCLSVNDTVIHGGATDYVLKSGDILDIDIGVCYEGYHADSAWTYTIGEVTPEVQRLVNVTLESLKQGIAKAKHGNKVNDIAGAIQKYVESNGYSIVKEFTGHGIGQHLHEEPAIPNFVRKGNNTVLKEGMVICIEPMVNMGDAELTTEDDGWTVKTLDGSLSAHFEHTVIITKGKPEIVTENVSLVTTV
jgi:methionyl aminopeptidase